jgi:excinuclease UvrABC ATPase subunit
MDFAQPNSKPGRCIKCKGDGVYKWGVFENGRPSKTGTCYSCRGTGFQDWKQIKRNQVYNATKKISI